MAGLPRETTREQVVAALDQFDRELRPTPKWAGWDAKKAQKFVLAHAGRTYPPKQVIALATGCGVNTFSGGDETNRFLRARGFTIQDLRASDAP